MWVCMCFHAWLLGLHLILLFIKYIVLVPSNSCISTSYSSISFTCQKVKWHNPNSVPIVHLYTVWDVMDLEGLCQTKFEPRFFLKWICSVLQLKKEVSETWNYKIDECRKIWFSFYGSVLYSLGLKQEHPLMHTVPHGTGVTNRWWCITFPYPLAYFKQILFLSTLSHILVSLPWRKLQLYKVKWSVPSGCIISF